MHGVDAFSIIGVRIFIVMALATGLRRGRLEIEICSAMLFMAYSAGYAGLLVRFCIGSVKLRCRMTPDAGIFERLVRRMAGSARVTVRRDGDRAVLYVRCMRI